MGATKKDFTEQRSLDNDFLQSLHEPKKEDFKDIDFEKEVYNLTQRVVQGYTDELRAYIMMSKLEKLFANAKEAIKENAIANFDSYGQKTVEFGGAKISATQSGRYNYSNCEEWNNLKIRMNKIQENMKAAQKLGGDFIDKETGEVYEPATYTSSKRSLAVKIK